MATGSQNQGMMGHPGAIRMILLYGESCNITPLPNMADSGKVYASWSYHGKLRATCCWTSWQIGLVEASATCCILLGRPPEGETTLFGWSGLAWIACLRPHSASLCRAFRVTWFLAHQVKILQSKAQSGPDLMPPSLFMYDTTVVLSVSTSTILCIQRSWNSCKARKTALSSR